MDKIGITLKETVKLYNEVLRSKAMEEGISGTELFIINILSCAKEEVTQKDICEYSRMKAPTISLTLQNMEDKGLIQRIKSKDDLRKTICSLTELGKKYSTRICGMYEEINESLKNCLTEEERECLDRSLSKMKNKLEEMKCSNS